MEYNLSMKPCTKELEVQENVAAEDDGGRWSSILSSVHQIVLGLDLCFF